MNAFYASVSETGLQLLSKETDRVLESLPIVKASEEHRNFIISTWVRSYEPVIRKLVFCGMRVSQETYRLSEGRVAEREWERSHVVVSPDDNYTIHAWVCAAAGYLWHVYVPPQLRGNGIARGLVETFAGKTYEVSKPWPKGPPKGHLVTYNPYMNGNQ